MHQPVTYAVQGLQVELIVALDGYEAHVVSRHRFGDRLGIDEIVLVGSYERLHELCRDQPHILALIAQACADKMRTCTSFDAHQRLGQVRRVGQPLFAGELLPDNNFAALVQCHQMKRRLAPDRCRQR
jgi:hypothetical protein